MSLATPHTMSVSIPSVFNRRSSGVSTNKDGWLFSSTM
jgi:hypothetical protein